MVLHPPREEPRAQLASALYLSLFFFLKNTRPLCHPYCWPALNPTPCLLFPSINLKYGKHGAPKLLESIFSPYIFEPAVFFIVDYYESPGHRIRSHPKAWKLGLILYPAQQNAKLFRLSWFNLRSGVKQVSERWGR